jgi:polyferredoxin
MNLFFRHTDAEPPPGLRRRADAVLGRLGPGWRAAPWRHLVQAACLAGWLVLFFHVADSLGPDFSGGLLARKEWVPAEALLWLDPLVGTSASLAARAWTPALAGAIAVLTLCLLFPRGFCAYVCPLGTLIDVFDRFVGRRFARARMERPGRWRGARYGVLVFVLAAAAVGVALAGYAAAIPILTRGFLLTGGRIQAAAVRGWSQVPPMGAAAYVSVALFAAVFLLGLLGRRFWCRTLCPTGAMLSVFSVLRLTERAVGEACTGCGRCRRACAFDAIAEDFTTRPLDCTFCQECGGVCPAGAIEFSSRRKPVRASPAGERPRETHPVSRRAFVAAALGGAAAAAGLRGARPRQAALLRPPGAIEESRFLSLCVRCGECMKVCPGPVLHPAGLEGGLEALWTPVAVPSVAGCHQDCHFCTQVCPTGAIRPLTLAEKRRAVMGLAVVNTSACLPHAGRRDCRLCFDACERAGYRAIRMGTIRLEVGDIPEGAVSDADREAMGRIEAPFVDAEVCTGCGQCENRCHKAYVEREGVLGQSAIVVTAGGRGTAARAHPDGGA